MQFREKRCQKRRCKNTFLGNPCRRFCDSCLQKTKDRQARRVRRKYQTNKSFRQKVNAYSQQYRKKHARHINEYNKRFMKIQRLKAKGLPTEELERDFAIWKQSQRGMHHRFAS